ncbi:MAG: hypothetical protein IKR69_07960 [Bacteroidales bacterium]|nr:hypothetical protein [Bacteroidales bacterium]
MSDNRKRHVVSYEKMSEEVAAVFAQKYPRGYNDYLGDLVQYPKPDGTFFYAVTIEIPDAIYLVKINVKTDDLEDVERWLEGEDVAAAEAATGGTTEDDSSDTLPDDNIAQYGSSSDDTDE